MKESGEKGEEIHNDTLIGNFFSLRHYEGKGTDELQFVHRSIYEYFVVIYFFESLHKLKTKEEVAGKLGELLKDGKLSWQMLEFIKCKFDNTEGLNLPDIIKEVFNIMLRDGMTHHIKEPCKNIVERERKIFTNMLLLMGLWSPFLGELDRKFIIYLQCNREVQLYLRGIQLGDENDDMERAYLSRAYLREADLKGANLKGADLRGADLRGADLRGAYSSEADLKGAILCETILNAKQVNILYEKYDLSKSMVFLSKEDKIISYQEYRIRKQRS